MVGPCVLNVLEIGQIIWEQLFGKNCFKKSMKGHNSLKCGRFKNLLPGGVQCHMIGKLYSMQSFIEIGQLTWEQLSRQDFSTDIPMNGWMDKPIPVYLFNFRAGDIIILLMFFYTKYESNK